MRNESVAGMTRRGWLRLGGLGGAMAAALLAGCAAPLRFEGSFLQPWESYAALPETEWRRRLQATRALGCEEIVLQWSGHEGGANPWVLPEPLLQSLFDEAGRAGMGIRLGLPYDERWWPVLAATAPDARGDFLRATQGRSLQAMQDTRWTRQPGFRGWYLPYEIDAYNWATPARQRMLADWLQPMAETARAEGRPPLAVSTFHSQLQTEGRLTAVWTTLLDRMPLRPMLQDGVGVAGLDHAAGLDSLSAMLRQRGVAFDWIVELFEQLPAADGSSAFHARAATTARVRQQLQLARRSGADRVIAFAVDPWMLGQAAQ
ncbi:DUF4434 domain-containing protein [Variovorax ginsengisoli]|uniref:DUF4434 domain-containing protein n=1 Tax=Variovorax ginsengisoli TaxID=363844 RepID=A0ABT9S8F7_9BURK|nr:DUF4434 domain-containing protein [Variovorax ginsengisoli]MDP9900640.1 hypothetical protein [Variovorax ginsengisoli]